VQEDKASPVRDESSIVPYGTCLVYEADSPSHKWLGYFHEILAKMSDSDRLQSKRSFFMRHLRLFAAILPAPEIWTRKEGRDGG
jgi:hypothetical protein